MGVHFTQARTQLFRRFDRDDSGTLSLADVHQAIAQLWPDAEHKPALMRAYYAADVGQDGSVGPRSFRLLLEHLAYFNEHWQEFEQVEASEAFLGGKPLAGEEDFIASCSTIGVRLSGAEAAREFRKMGLNDSGKMGHVRFGAFCTWAARLHEVCSLTHTALTLAFRTRGFDSQSCFTPAHLAQALEPRAPPRRHSAATLSRLGHPAALESHTRPCVSSCGRHLASSARSMRGGNGREAGGCAY